MREEKTDNNEKGVQESNLISYHQSLLDLCNRLEHLADSLPDRIDTQECLAISFVLYPTIKAAHQFEETKIFPLLAEQEKHEVGMSKKIERLQFEHWEDESFAEDLSQALRQLVSSPKSANIDKISYMLRGFFEGLRRHIAFETDYIVPMLK